MIVSKFLITCWRHVYDQLCWLLGIDFVSKVDLQQYLSLEYWDDFIKALYRKMCRSHTWWFRAEYLKPLGVYLVKHDQDKAKSIQVKLLAAQSL